MMSDLRNLKTLAWFLQKFELKFDILSSLRELSKQIKREFDFRLAVYFTSYEECRSLTTSYSPQVSLIAPVFDARHVLELTDKYNMHI